MPLRRRLRPLLVAALVVAMIALLWLGSLALRQAVALGPGEALLMAWMLAFVVGLPAAILVLGLAGQRPRSRALPAVVPFVGVKIPRLGQ